jgi:hypothetical protein
MNLKFFSQSFQFFPRKSEVLMFYFIDLMKYFQNYYQDEFRVLLGLAEASTLFSACIYCIIKK